MVGEQSRHRRALDSGRYQSSGEGVIQGSTLGVSGATSVPAAASVGRLTIRDYLAGIRRVSGTIRWVSGTIRRVSGSFRGIWRSEYKGLHLLLVTSSALYRFGRSTYGKYYRILLVNAFSSSDIDTLLNA